MLVQESMNACPAINTVSQVHIRSGRFPADMLSQSGRQKILWKPLPKMQIAFVILKPCDRVKISAMQMRIAMASAGGTYFMRNCGLFSSTTGRHEQGRAGWRDGGSLLLFVHRAADDDFIQNLGHKRQGETIISVEDIRVDGKELSLKHRTVSIGSVSVPGRVARVLFDSEEDAERAAAAVRAAIRIWKDEDNSLRQSERLPGYAGLEGMLENPEAVRCVLDVGDDFFQDGDTELDMTLLDAIDVVKSEKYRVYHGIEDSKTLEFWLFGALPIEGNAPKGAVLAEERPKDAAAEQ